MYKDQFLLSSGCRIGDRHASNFMYEERTGRLVGIDFGHAFGSATMLLPGIETKQAHLHPLTAQLPSYILLESGGYISISVTSSLCRDALSASHAYFPYSPGVDARPAYAPARVRPIAPDCPRGVPPGHGFGHECPARRRRHAHAAPPRVHQ